MSLHNQPGPVNSSAEKKQQKSNSISLMCAEQSLCHTPQVLPLKPCAPVSGCCLPKTDPDGDSGSCLLARICSKAFLCVIQAGRAQKLECDHLIKVTIRRQGPLRSFSYCLFFSQGALIPRGALRNTLQVWPHAATVSAARHSTQRN